MAYKSHISVDSRRHFGKPCVMGNRILVEQVLESLQEGLSSTEIICHYYLDLTLADVKACAVYATDLVQNEEIHLETL